MAQQQERLSRKISHALSPSLATHPRKSARHFESHRNWPTRSLTIILLEFFKTQQITR